MSVYEITTIIISGLTLIVTIAIYVVVNKKQVEQLAKSFIIDNNEIYDYIPLCVVASSLNRHKKHYRKLYNEFNKLADDVQKEVIKQCNYEIDLLKETEWVSKSINYVNKFLNDNNLGNDRNNYLYDDGKYIHYAIRNYPEKEYDDRMYNKKYQNPFPSKRVGFEGNNPVEYLIDFDTYCEDYMFYVIRSTRKDFIIYKSEKIAPKPIKYLEVVENLSSTNTTNEDVCYWVLDFVNFFSIYIINITIKKGYPNEYKSDYEIETYEDKYYEVMLSLYLLYKLVICETENK